MCKFQANLEAEGEAVFGDDVGLPAADPVQDGGERLGLLVGGAQPLGPPGDDLQPELNRYPSV